MASSAVISVRRSEPDDADFVNALIVDDHTLLRQRYGNFNVINLIERSYLCITALNDVGEVVGFAAFTDAPPMLGAKADDWMTWYQLSTGHAAAALGNTLWLTFFVGYDQYALDVSENVLRTMFTTLPEIDRAILLLASDLELFNPLDQSFSLPTPTADPAADAVPDAALFGRQRAFVCNRELFIPTLVIRAAQVEDHDDLVPIFNSQSDVLTDLYGEFFLAELIEAQDATNRALAAEVEGRAVGLMTLSANVELDVLQRCFELAPYNSLLQQTAAEIRAAEQAAVLAAKARREWFTQLQQHPADIESAFKAAAGASASASGNADIQQLIRVLNDKGQDWCFEGPRGRGLGTCLAKDLGLSEGVISYAAFNEALDRFATKRLRSLRARSVYQWYESYRGRDVILQAFDVAVSYARKRGAVADEAEPTVAVGDLAAVLSVVAKEARHQHHSDSIGDDVLDELALDAESSADAVVPINKAQLEAALNNLERAMADYQALRVVVMGGPGAGRSTLAVGLASARKISAVDAAATLAQLKVEAANAAKVPEDEDADSDSEAKVSKAPEDPVAQACAAFAQRLAGPEYQAGWVLYNVPEDVAEAIPLARAIGGLQLAPTVLRVAPPDNVARDRAISSRKYDDATYGKALLAWRKAGDTLVAAFSGGAPPVIVDSSGTKEAAVAAAVMELEDAGAIRAPYDTSFPAAEDEEVSQEREVPKSNAFSVTLFCLDQVFESRANDFLAYAFDQFPDREYCVLTLPHSVPETPLLGRFTLVAPKPSSTLPHVLYVMHRGALLMDRFLRVRRATKADRIGLQALAAGVESAAMLLSAVSKAERFVGDALSSMPEYVAFVAECQDQLVGACVLSQAYTSEAQVQALRDGFELDRFLLLSQHRPRNQCTLEGMIVNPIFAPASRYILRQGMRMYDKSVVYYRLPRDAKPSTVLDEFVQVRPRVRVQPAGSAVPGSFSYATGKTLDTTTSADNAFSLYFLSQKLMSEPKLMVNARVVVVGASDTGIACLSSFLFVPYLNFSSLTLIARGGLPPATGTTNPEWTNWTAAPSYMPNDLVQLGLQHRVFIVDASVVEIDRAGKAVVLQDESVVPYDYLILATGLQDQAISRATEGFEDAADVSQLAFNPAVHTAVPSIESIVARLPRNGRMPEVAVYGNDINAYAAMEALMSRGIPGPSIVHIRPPLGETKRAIEDDRACKLAEDAIVEANIRVVLDATIAELHATRQGGMLSVVLDCDVNGVGKAARQEQVVRLLLCADKPDIDPLMFNAINSSGLVYDGRLVVNHRFQTSQADIFAAGRCVKFSRRYRAKTPLELCNAMEQGAAVAAAVLVHVDPLQAGVAAALDTAGGPTTLPKLSLPRRTVARLPGGLHYLHVRLPEYSVGEIGRDMATRSVVGDEGFSYCKLTLDQFERLAELVYLGTVTVETDNLTKLVGRHASFLNSIVREFDSSNISDFVSFFRQDWALALYSDRFDALCLELHETLAEDETVKSFLQAAGDAAERGASDAQLSKQRKEAVGGNGIALAPSTKRTIETHLLEFLRANRFSLPNYFLPSA